MSAKRKNTSSQHKYTTRQIMEITEERRQKKNIVKNKSETKDKVIEKKKAAVTPQELFEPVTTPARPIPPAAKTDQTPVPPAAVPANAVVGALILIISLIGFILMVSSRSSEFWVHRIADKLNVLIVDGSFIVLKLIQGPCSLAGEVLKTHYYKVSLKGDLVAFYSLEMLIVFAALFIYFQKTSVLKRGIVLISLIPLAVMANILRLVVAFGLALNYSPAFANQYFYTVLVGGVFVFIVIGLLILESLSSPE